MPLLLDKPKCCAHEPPNIILTRKTLQSAPHLLCYPQNPLDNAVQHLEGDESGFGPILSISEYNMPERLNCT